MAIETIRLSRRFGTHLAVNDVSLTVPDGAIFALLGTNGAGKTTTLRMLLDLIRPDSGVARIGGVAAPCFGPRERARIGYVSENQKLPERLTVAQYFDYLRPLYDRWDLTLEHALRESFDLPPDRRLGKLSHGMRMKAMLASVLAFRPDTLVLDEPLSGLDPLTRDQVVDGLLREADGATILISSHEIAEIESLASHVGFMDRGELVFQNDIDSLLARFRVVTAILAGERVLPDSVPDSWIGVELTGRQLRYVETAFESHDATLRQLGRRFGPVRIEPEPLSLREITTTLMRARQQARA